ncbi:hypothetical protein BWI97_26870, partial [Siphonobacter sp. BAB-5405]|uniref:hypothetical protein n=1 Tax=Siphonobacter sp. BAB-5405 TaxID=1864825 RepID=UPI000CC75650
GKHTDLGLSYRGNRIKSRNEQQSLRTYALPDTSYFLRESSLSDAENWSHTLHMHFNHQIDSLTSLRVYSSLLLQQSENRSDRYSQTFPTGTDLINPINESRTENTSDGTGISGSTNVSFNRNFLKKGRNLLVN